MSRQRPNIVFITADDMAGDTPGAFGGPPGVTPNLDALAAEGMCFQRAHVPAAVCQPSRSAMMTGKWPHRNGAEGFEPINDGVTTLTDLLSAAGYRTGILGKVDHLAPVQRFGWDHIVQREDLAQGRSPAKYADHAAQFIADADANGQSWFLMANAHDPHRPFHGSDQESKQFTDDERDAIPEPSTVYSPEDTDPPGFLPDLPAVRREYAEYLSSSRRCDDVVGAVLEVIEAAGHADNTLVVFLSDNGMAFPFAKANCYLQSTRTPLIVRWPGRTQPGRVDDAHFVNGLDLFPTFCEAAGVAVPEDVDGTTLSRLISGDDEAGRERVFSVFHETSAKHRFEMRCVQDDKYGYIWNAWADGVTAYRSENMTGRTWAAMASAAERDADVFARADFYLRRAPEELYDLRTDPDALNNLADDPDHYETLTQYRKTLQEWMTSTNDPLG